MVKSWKILFLNFLAKIVIFLTVRDRAKHGQKFGITWVLASVIAQI